MRSVLFLLTTLIVMGLAFWAYRENYATQSALTRMDDVQRQIGGLREDLVVLRAEWAYLNRPGRLRELVNMNFDKLKLLPFGADQFVDVGIHAHQFHHGHAPLVALVVAAWAADRLIQRGRRPISATA